MKQTIIIVVFALCALFVSAPAALAADDCTFAAVKANVNKAVEIINAKGKAGFAEVSAMRYCDGKGYIYVQELTGVMLAHGVLPHLVGRNVASMKDAKGKQFAIQSLNDVKEKGESFFTYYWPKPGTKEVSLKCGYGKKAMVDGKPVFVGSGLYDIPEAECGK